MKTSNSQTPDAVSPQLHEKHLTPEDASELRAAKLEAEVARLRLQLLLHRLTLRYATNNPTVQVDENKGVVAWKEAGYQNNSLPISK